MMNDTANKKSFFSLKTPKKARKAKNKGGFFFFLWW